MSPMSISWLVFAVAFGGALFGMCLRGLLREHHLGADTKDIVKLGMGLIGTMTALVLGLLIASAKSSYDTQRSGLAQLSANVILLDRALAHYGSASHDTRARLRVSIADMIQHTWPQENSESGKTTAKTRTEGKYEGLYEQIQGLAPKTDGQRALQAQALKTATDIAQTRWLLFAQKGSSIPTPFLVVMVCWLALILASFGLYAPPNAMTLFTLLVCALAVSSAIFLILELDRPFEGLMQISGAPLRDALAQLGK
jgi:hypothetical protein